MVPTSFTLTIDVSAASDGEVEEVNQLQNSIGSADHCDLTPVIAAEHIRLSTAESSSRNSNSLVLRRGGEASSLSSPPLAAVFSPSTLIESSFEQLQLAMNQDAASLSSSSPHAIRWLDREPQQISQILLNLIHPFLAENFTIKAIVSSATHQRHNNSNTTSYHAPSDLVLLDHSHVPLSVIDDLVENLSSNCPTIHSGPESVLKVVLINRVNFCAIPSEAGAAAATANDSISHTNGTKTIDIPSCPVCLHRVDPFRLGLPRPRNQAHMCSKFCPPPNLAATSKNSAVSCPRQRLLRPWPAPSSCASCQVIERYWQRDEEDSGINDDNNNRLVCMTCGMKETLWVCLTCGFVGCGRYSSKHAVQHNSDTRHPFCLELSTLRIWSYVDGEFAHRVDLLECPSSPPLLQPWVARGRRSSFRASATSAAMIGDDYSDYTTVASTSATSRNTPYDMSLDDYERMIAANFASVDEKSPKKATMIGEEYEALLQSALEEQAQHYEGEITGLRAKLTAEQVDQESMTQAEAAEIENLKKGIAILRENIDRVGRDLLALQAQEAGHRATSQRLLREQRVTQDLLTKIREESSIEHEQGRLQIEELEQQIADLTANQKMMQQFSQNEDLKNSQIFGASEQSPNPKAKRGKKKRGGFFRR